MTAVQRQTVKVYIVDFRGCRTRLSFYRKLAQVFGVSLPLVRAGREFWESLCRQLASLARTPNPIRIRLIGIENARSIEAGEIECLLRILRAASARAEDFRAEAIVGDAKWPI